MKKFFSIFIAVAFAILVSASPAISDTPQQQFLKSKGCEKGLIVNADDFGRSVYSNEGIVKAMDEGIVTSTTLMVPALNAKEAFEIAKERPDLDIGVHLVLARDDVEGNLYGPVLPLEEASTLVDENGYFFTDIDTYIKDGDKGEVGKELYTQFKIAMDNGVDVTHMDCHKGFYHTYDPKSLKAVLKIATKFNLPIRWIGSSQDPKLTAKGIIVPDYTTMISMDTPHEEKKATYIKLIEELKPGITEFVLHPATGGYSERENVVRNSELQIAIDPDIKKAIEDNGVCLVGYRELRDFQRQLSEEKE